MTFTEFFLQYGLSHKQIIEMKIDEVQNKITRETV